MVASKLRKELSEAEWEITIIDHDELHHYQPGWLFIPFGVYGEEDCVKPKREFIPAGVEFVLDEVVGVNPDKREVEGQKGRYNYDWLVIASGCHIVPEEVEGMMDDWYGDVHTFYTLEGAAELRKKLKYFDSGRVWAAGAENRNWTADNNCYWNASGGDLEFLDDLTLDDWRALGFDAGSIVNHSKRNLPSG